MGRIKTIDIRVITDKLLTKYKLSDFSRDFRKNKEKLKSLPEEFPSKKVLNRVAGNLTRLFKKKETERAKLLGKEVV